MQLEYDDYYLVCVYVPNARTSPKEYRQMVRQAEKKGTPVPDETETLARFEYRMKWEDDFRAYLSELASKKHVVICGDMNVAHHEIDLKNPTSNKGNCGFTDEERDKFGRLLEAGFVDTFRVLFPDKTDAYSWWSYRFNARKNNAGWRIDYFLVDEGLKDSIRDAVIYADITGSDHCPVGVTLDI